MRLSDWTEAPLSPFPLPPQSTSVMPRLRQRKVLLALVPQPQLHLPLAPPPVVHPHRRHSLVECLVSHLVNYLVNRQLVD